MAEVKAPVSVGFCTKCYVLSICGLKTSRIARGSYLDLTIHALSIVDIGRYHCVLTRFGRQSTKSEIGPPSRLIVSDVEKLKHISYVMTRDVQMLLGRQVNQWIHFNWARTQTPPIIIWPKSYQINYRNIGELFSIECKAEGVPPPEVNWTKNDEIISTGPILRIEKLEKKHEGIYICLAVNVEGRAFSQFELKFSKLPKFILFPTNQTVLEGSDVLWRCRADGYQSNALRYSWMFSDRPIKTTSTGARVDMKEDGDISITNIRKKDRGWYSCCVLGPSDEKAQTGATNLNRRNLDDRVIICKALLAGNKVEHFLSRSIIEDKNDYLQKYREERNAPEALPSHKQVLIIGYGKSERLTCLVDGNPKPNIYTWAKNGHFIATSTEHKNDSEPNEDYNLKVYVKMQTRETLHFTREPLKNAFPILKS
ncbi:immunoglobulin domain protein [Dictyocaulus viviparus]|uniref:Immunoglobulin domain protein n=1 Tax=Dictyocaulus viviparus TaxID=29172 RepID=A0A0D8XSC2_DICVI|nr:immunoglobulin domain protein [Dictyocaulus viviparus]